MGLLWPLFARYSRPHSRSIVALVALALVAVALEALLPWPLKIVVDHVLPGKPLPDGLQTFPQLTGSSSVALAWCAVAMLGLFLVYQLTQMLRKVFQAKLSARMQYDLAADVLERLQALSITYHSRAHRGDLARRVTSDTDSVPTLLTGVLIPSVSAVVALIVFFAIMWELDHGLAVLSAGVAVPMGIIMRLLGPRMSERAYEHQLTQGEVWSVTEQTLTALPVVQAFGTEEHEGRRFRGAANRSIRAYLRTMAIQLQFRIGVDACEAIGTALVLLVGGFKVLNGSLSVGALIVFLSYLAALYAPLLAFAYLSGTMANAAAGARRIGEVLEADEVVRDAIDAETLLPIPDLAGSHITFERLSFAYCPGRPVLQGIGLDVRAGETIALVGATGAGKSTLVSLIPRLIDPAEGRVLVDGQDIRGVTLESLRSRISVVLQDPFLLPISIAENIRFGRPDATRDDIVEAARRANAHEFVAGLPGGYDTVIGERGVTLSGGQRQRIAIARAFVKDASILILDEPTSALDAETEELVMQAVASLMQGRTTIIIAHRLSTVARADRIVVLDKGRVAETGSHDELLASGGLFYTLWLAQTLRGAADMPTAASHEQ